MFCVTCVGGYCFRVWLFTFRFYVWCFRWLVCWLFALCGFCLRCSFCMICWLFLLVNGVVSFVTFRYNLFLGFVMVYILIICLGILGCCLTWFCFRKFGLFGLVVICARVWLLFCRDLAWFGLIVCDSCLAFVCLLRFAFCVLVLSGCLIWFCFCLVEICVY